MDNKILAPVCLFVYNRPELTKQTVAALQKNFLASESELFIFSDGAKNENTAEKVNQVREYIKTVSGFKRVTIFESTGNKGLANSIISGVSQIIEQYEKIIVVEDDLITSSNFLDFMNSGLVYYENNDKIFSIAGYTTSIKNPDTEIYFTQRASGIGWATWKNRWYTIDWNINDYESFKSNSKLKKQFNRMGSDMCKMLNAQMTGKIDSWAIRWCYNQFKHDQYTVFPTISKVKHIGIGADATHAKDKFDRFNTVLDTSSRRNFAFINNVNMDEIYLKQFLKQYSLFTRIKYKLLNLFFP